MSKENIAPFQIRDMIIRNIQLYAKEFTVFCSFRKKPFRKVSTFAKKFENVKKMPQKAAFLILSYLKDGFDTLFDCGEISL